jgi:hypothetical protein
MGISKKQFTLAAKAGLTREQATRFIGTAGQEPSPTEAYDKVGQLLKGRTPGQAMKQVEPTLKKPEPATSAKAGIKPIEPEVSKAQPPEQPKTDATKPTDLIKPIDPATSATQPQGKVEDAATADKMIKTPYKPKDFSNTNIPKNNKPWKKWAETDLGTQDPTMNDFFQKVLEPDLYKSIGGYQVKNSKNNAYVSVGTRMTMKDGIWGTVIANISLTTTTEDNDRGTEVKTHELAHMMEWAYAINNGRGVNDLLTDDKDLKDYSSNWQINKKAEKYFADIKIKVDEIREKVVNDDEYITIGIQLSSLKEEYRQTKNPEIADKYNQLARQSNAVRENLNKTGHEEIRGLTGRGVNAISDIYSALSRGRLNDTWGLNSIGSHSPKYYQDKKQVNSEIWANYMVLKSLKDPTNFNRLKEFEPELVKILDKVYQKGYNNLVKGIK